ncbi:MAG: YlxR family protein [Tissierellia bacterium]|nr:YlxR family protein [Tissierellia bacterium]
MNNRKIPQRKCVVCNQHKDKKDLLRIVKNKEGQIFVDPSGKMNGRGTYICPDLACLSKTKKNRSLNNSLKANIGDEIYQEIENYVKSR